MRRQFFVLVAVAALLPCAVLAGLRASRVMKTYPGPRLARAEVALVSRTIVFVQADQVDGMEVPGMLREYLDHLELRPGPHTLRLVYQMIGADGTTAASVRDVTISFEVEPGRIYELDPKLSSHPEPRPEDPTRTEYTWSPRVTDITGSDEREHAKLRERAEKAFRESREDPLEHLSTPRIVLVNLHYLRIHSLDGDRRDRGSMLDFLELSPGRHTLLVSSLLHKDEPPATVECSVEAGHTYALSQGGGLVWDPFKPTVVDITAEMDNVKQSLVPKILKFLKK
ncbi:MAG: hypothetical protein AB2L07_08775 [Thermoanaerobaculaceae bacterium]